MVMTKHLLIAEDDDDMGSLLSLRLTQAGYSVTWTRDGQSAWDAIQKEMPRVAILDVMMPGMNGFQVLERIKATPKTNSIAVIMLTAKRQPTDLSQGFQAGATEYLVKPFKPSELLDRVASICPIDPETPPAA